MVAALKLSAGLFPVYPEFQKAPDEKLKKIALMGYEGIELYGNFFHPAEKIQELCQKYKLEVSGAQTSWRYLNQAHLQEVMDYHHILGNKNIIISALGGPWESGHKKTENTRSIWQAHIEKMNQLQEALSRNGFTLSYHTHDYDFNEKIEGQQTSFELIRENTNSLVGIEVDTGSSIKGNQCPQKLIAELGARARLVHAKPVKRDGSFDVNLGDSEDVNGWCKINLSCKQAGTQWLVVEPENERENGFTALSIGHRHLNNLVNS
ncbi:sugar phosphate isomerase/epimerase [Enterococcus avium]|uniref:sugar phosphate isomerase/epimerase family protein n=1 Tax=Enterococcus avium TaxID=33945 RepID=UPI00232DAFE6|nr:sugar phosphate isomerase/epimerase [Enterococcus avium]MDB1750204.1 sugar phosphate isomerase/epimerase [Enterococcus avium]MDB1754302.1 sugar phosphate isomerase/epimerase [Enterococcus avium]MDB1761386.1 sugar phosphate isomerase/epimerase [Enterococcus avium]